MRFSSPCRLLSATEGEGRAAGPRPQRGPRRGPGAVGVCLPDDRLRFLLREPAGAVAWPARFFVAGPGSQTSGASLPVGFVCSAADDAGRALVGRHLPTLAIDR